MFKLTVIILLAGCLQLSAKSFGQHITISKKNASLQELFLDIYKQSGYFFYCRDNLLTNARKVDIDVKDVSLEEVLEICFREQPLTYTISDHVIVVKSKPENNRKGEISIEIKGKVINDKGEPLEGADISLKGTNKGTQTDADGNFTLKVDENNRDFIVISFTGYETKMIDVSKNVFFKVILSVSSNPLDQVQVIAYGTTSKRLNTGNVSTVSSETIAKEPVSNPLAAIQGRMAGVYISQSTGVPGGEYKIQIRGQNSLRNNPGDNGNLPLYIVDGVPYPSVSLASTSTDGLITPNASPLSSINPYDIQSIEVLKDADATAIYGSRGANGVVLITTKKGKNGKTSIDINTYSGTEKLTRKMDLLNTQQYLVMRHEAFNNDGETPNVGSYDVNGAWDTTRYTNWQKLLLGKTAGINDVQSNISGGNANTQFLAGGSYHDQTTVFPGDFSDKKVSAHLNLTHHSNDKRFTFSISASYASDNNNLPSVDLTGLAMSLAPDAPALFNPDGTLNWQNSTWVNPFSYLRAVYKRSTNNLLASGALSYEVLNGLLLKVSGGYSSIETNESSINPLSANDPAFTFLTGSANYATSSFNNWILEPQIDYHKNLGIGKIQILAGATFQQNLTHGQSMTAIGYTSDALIMNLQAAPSIYINNYFDTKYRYAAAFSRITYNINDEYLVNLTGRRDGSSRFGADKQFENFGAIGVAWIFSHTHFIRENLPFISFGKLRGSYGLTGSDQIPDYGYLDSYSSTTFPYNGISGLVPSRIANPDYSWETNKKAEFSLALGFFKDRIIATASWFHNRSSNQLVGYSLAPTTGFSSVQANLPATVQNTGLELELNFIAIHSKSFSWTADFNLSLPRNKLLAYPNIEGSSYANTYTIGKSLYTQRLFHYIGVDPATGLYSFQDVNKDGAITYPEDLQAIKEVGITAFGGFENSFQYKGVQLDFLFQFVKQTGYTYLNSFGLTGAWNASGSTGNQPSFVLSRWQKPGDKTDIQRFTQSFGSDATTAFFESESGDNSIGDASFIRLKNVSLSYELPAHLINKAGISRVKVYLEGQNLLTITHYKGLDPENQSAQVLPPLCTLTGGIQFSF